jgi:myo-inositol-1(or 4)-monophosphatase
VDSKTSDTDLVSDADRAAEEVISSLLAAERPGDGLLAEEGSSREAASGRRWIVDPLDGTINYLYRLPVWCVSVALEDANGLAVGVVYHPLRDELFAAERGSGSFLGDRRLRVRDGDRLERALVATGFSYDAGERAVQARLAASLLPQVRDIRRAGAAALDLAWVAAGRLDGYYERGGHPWDWAAGRLLVTEAGGAVADLPGDPPGLAAANPALLPALAELVG